MPQAQPHEAAHEYGGQVGMTAALRDRHGPPEVVEVKEVDRPTPAADQVLVRIRAASVNRPTYAAPRPWPAGSRLAIGAG